MAESDLQSLLDKINVDGVQKAQAKYDTIIAEAQAKAESIIKEANEEAACIKNKAQAEADALTNRANSAIAQAARDVIRGLKAELETRLLRVTANATAQAFSPEFMASLIKEIANKFTSDVDGNLSIITSVKDVAALEAALKNALAADLVNNTNVLGSTELAGGLEVSVKDGQLYFDFTVEAVTALVKEYVGPRLAQLLEGNN